MQFPAVRRWYLGLGLGITLLVAVTGGCAGWWNPELQAIQPQFSSDSTVFAAIFVQDHYGFSLPNPGGSSPKSQTASFRWAYLANPGKIRTVDLGTADGSGHSGRLALRLSPDASYAAVLAAGQLRIIALATGDVKVWSGQGESVTAFAWLGDKEIVYASHVAGSGNTSTRMFYRRSADGSSERKMVSEPTAVEGAFDDYGPRAARYSLTEAFSPRGGYVLFSGGAFDSSVSLLDVRSGRVMKVHEGGVSQPTSLSSRVAWRLDDSAAMCLVHGKYPVPGALLVRTVTGVVDDVSPQLASRYKENVWLASKFWTADGKYCIFNGGHYVEPLLISPDPWEVLSLRTPATEAPACDLFGWSPVPGTFVHNQKLTRYDGTTLRSMAYNEVLSHDGRHVAIVDRRDDFVIRDSGLRLDH